MSKPSSYSGMNKLDIWDNEGSSSNLSCKQKLLQSCDFQLSPSVFFILRLGACPAPSFKGNQLNFSYFITTLTPPRSFSAFHSPLHTPAQNMTLLPKSSGVEQGTLQSYKLSFGRRFPMICTRRNCWTGQYLQY